MSIYDRLAETAERMDEYRIPKNEPVVITAREIDPLVEELLGRADPRSDKARTRNSLLYSLRNGRTTMFGHPIEII